MDIFITNATIAGVLAPVEPFIVNWSRLEPLPVTPDLQAGLQARIGDPLWLIGRQWQFNEFQGDDAGSPIAVRLQVDCAQIDRVRFGPARPSPPNVVSDFAGVSAPLEVAVEAEREPPRALRIVAEAGLQLQRRLRSVGMIAAAEALPRAFPLALPAIDPVTDGAGASWLGLLHGRAIDATAVAAAMQPLVGADGALSGVPVIAGFTPADAGTSKLKAAFAEWFAEYRSAFETGGDDRSAWVPDRQEYAFAARVKLPDATALVDATEYTDGHLDWHSFTLADDPGLGEPSTPVTATVLSPSPKLPTPVRYPGMPADRYWEFEDATVSFGSVGAGPTELMRLLLVEFALVYGNDWFYVPFDLPVGTLCSISQLNVQDTFGVATDLTPSRHGPGGPWRMFELTNVSPLPDRAWFFLAPTLPARLQGDPIEEVALFRDEMANMAWGVERLVQSPVTGAVNRSLEPYESTLHQSVQGGAIDAELVYRLQTDVPDRWIPLVPVAEALPGSGSTASTHVLERRALLRSFPDGTRRSIHPRGQLLRTDETMPVESEPALRMADEEVPREGAVVRRAYQYTRWLDGTSHLWLGRDKRVGRGEGGSGLRFDLLIRRSS